MSLFKVVIVEDEKKSREVLKNLLENYCPEINIVGIAESVPKGIEIINSVHPDIVFLDIEMQTSTGFDLLQSLDTLDFDVIFTTAYEQYALKAIKFSALDYLLKPIDINELKQAIHKLVKKRTKGENNEQLVQLINNLAPSKPHRIIISTSEDILFIEVNDIVRCEAQGAYTIFHLKDNSKLTASKNLKEYEMLLSEHNFFRIHNSHLVNINEVHKYIKSNGGYVEMKDGTKVSIAQNRKQEFLERMYFM